METSILTTYSWLITLILVGIGYFIKRHFDTNARKREINHTLWQENKISILIQFSEEVSKTNTMWNSFSINKIIEGKILADELYETISSRLSGLKKTPWIQRCFLRNLRSLHSKVF